MVFVLLSLCKLSILSSASSCVGSISWMALNGVGSGVGSGVRSDVGVGVGVGVGADVNVGDGVGVEVYPCGDT